MPITPYLRDQEFPPETLETMGAAFTQACQQLGLVDRNDPLTQMVARHIIELAQRGVRTRTALYGLTVEEFKSS